MDERSQLFWRRSSKTVPTLAAGKRIYAIGDIHGRLDLLDRVLQLIAVDMQAGSPTEHRLVFLGDYVDRGPRSAGVIDRLIEVSCRWNTVCLKGNHEALMLEALDHPASLENWTSVGGVATMMSYGTLPTIPEGADTAATTVAWLAQIIPPAHVEFLRDLRLWFEHDDFFFVHAGVRPKVPFSAQREDDLIWIRDEFLLYEGPFEKYVVHGHTPMREPDIRPNRINVDTGAYATSRLTCLVLEGDTKRFLG